MSAAAAGTSAGARLTLPGSGATLTLPEGALAPGQTQDMFISVAHDTKQYPDMRDGGQQQTLLSPVVLCGPVHCGPLLKKPVIISFPHVASLRHGNWNVSVASSEYIMAKIQTHMAQSDHRQKPQHRLYSSRAEREV